jgi:tetratricopeptide (TPR) repeat protein
MTIDSFTPAVISRNLTLALLLVLACFSAAAGQGAHTLQGRVIGPDGIPPTSPVKVTLTFNGRRIYETFTDLSGRYSFTSISKGTYQLTAEGDGQTFETTSVYAEVSAFGSAPQLFTQDIQLRPLAGKRTPRPGVVNAFTQDVPKAAREARERALKLAGEGKPEDAIEKLREAIEIFPEYFDAHLLLGNQFLKSGRLDEAIVQLDRAREINAKDERVYQSFGLVLMQQKKYAVAVAVFSEASRLNPLNPMNSMMRATALIHQAYAIYPPSSERVGEDIKYILSRCQLALEQTAELSERKLKPDHFTLAMFYEMKGDREGSAKELEEYLRINPNVPDADNLRKLIQRLHSPVNNSHANPNPAFWKPTSEGLVALNQSKVITPKEPASFFSAGCQKKGPRVHCAHRP